MQLMFYSFFIIIIATIINVQSYIYTIYLDMQEPKEARREERINININL